MTNAPNSTEKKSPTRWLAFTLAGVICFGAALFLGLSSWLLFGTNHRLTAEKKAVAVQISDQNNQNNQNNQSPAIDNLNANRAAVSPPIAAAPPPPPEIVKAPAGEIAIAGGEVTLGGGKTKLPLRRVAVAAFAIGETEVTNEQYAEFIAESKHSAPANWKDGKFPNGTAAEPVVEVSWADANDYCAWLSKKIGATARLPTEAEWELAARGSDGLKYPWGNDWKNDAAESYREKGSIRPVKTYPEGRTATGIYDMIGNAYEWTSDLYLDENGKPDLLDGAKQRVMKSGSSEVKSDVRTIKFSLPRPEDKPSRLLGFRYVVQRG